MVEKMIREIKKEDRSAYLEMAKLFYKSDAVYQNIPEKHIEDTFNELMRSDCYAVAYIFEYEGKTAGYALLAKTFSQEAGGNVIWIEEIYIKPEFRSRGLGHEFFEFLHKKYPNTKRFRLEVEDSNQKAISLYKRLGFKVLPYSQMIKDF